MHKSFKKLKKSAAVLVAGLITCGLIAGCGGGGGDKKADSGKAKVLTFGCQMYSDGLIDPSLQTNTAWNCSRFGIGQTLFRFDDNVKAVPQLAESATPSDGNKTWTFKLKKGIKFSNGTEMTATKVKEYLDWIREEGKKGSTNPTKFLDAEAEVIADDAAGTVTIKSKKAYADMPASLADPAMVILDVKGSTNMKTAPVGTGPYMVKSFKDQVGYELVANPHYWNGKPPYDEVKILFMGDASAKANALRAGQIDLAENIMNVADLKAMQEDKNTKMWELAGGSMDNVDGKTAFDGFRAGDRTATDVVNKYINYLGCGLTNMVNIFQPEVLLIGGGICKEGKNLTDPLIKYIAEECYCIDPNSSTKLDICKLGNDAGIIGAAYLYTLQ